MALTVDHLGVVREELFKARAKWYDIGLALKVPVNTLDSIKLDVQFGNHSDKLRETLKIWLKTATEPSWQDVVGVLKSPVVGEPKLASDIEAKYCTTAETGQASGPTMPEVQQPQPTTRGTELHTLQQALQDSRELRDKDQQDSQRHIHTLQQELQTKDQQLRDSQRHIHKFYTLQQELQDSQRQNEKLTHQVENKNQQLKSIEKDLLQREQTIGELRAAIDQLKRQLQQAQQQIKHATEERERQVRELTKQLLAMKRPGPPPQKTAMQQKAIQEMRWQKESKAPERMYRGSAVVDANIAYFNGQGHTTVHSYDLDTREWCRLPDAPHTEFTLVVVHHILTMVGGQISGRATDSLLSLMGEGRGEKWLPNLPAMPTKRYLIVAVCSGHSLIVAGGEDGSNRLATVEVLDTDTRQWSIASTLPHPFSEATISICGERLYMLGGYRTGFKTRSVLSCSIPELLQSCQTQPLAGKLQTASTNKSTIWKHAADAPHLLSSCATLCGQLVAVGGYKADKSTSAISVYKETTDSWEAMGDMPTARSEALVAILNGKMMVVGGMFGCLMGTATDIVEILC